MNFCCDSIDEHFNEERARDDLDRYKTDGPDATTSALLNFLRAEEIKNATLLDIGGGIGVIPFELLEQGIERATLVEASSSFLRLAESEALRKGVRDRITLVNGDAVEVSGRLAVADLVTMDRVVCCYPDCERLIDRSASKARRWYALSYPRDRWFVRLGIYLENLVRRLRGNPFRSFVHDPLKIHDRLKQSGFVRHRRDQNALWQMDIYRRA